ncbi:MAG: ankyrin repeat domain-containing protein [Planctomycetota bacterium]|jgi:ankyrin repeat protein
MSDELCRASWVGDLSLVQSLVDAGVDVNAPDRHGQGSLLTGQPRVIEYLLENGADPNCQKNEFGASVVAGLCYIGASDCVRLLLEAGADVNAGRKESGESPLHHGLARCRVDQDDTHQRDCISLLIQHGADVNSTTIPGVVSANAFFLRTRGETPLHRAAAWASQSVIELLLNAGADPAIQDANHERPVEWAGWHRREKHIGELLNPAR